MAASPYDTVDGTTKHSIVGADSYICVILGIKHGRLYDGLLVPCYRIGMAAKYPVMIPSIVSINIIIWHNESIMDMIMTLSSDVAMEKQTTTV